MDRAALLGRVGLGPRNDGGLKKKSVMTQGEGISRKEGSESGG